MWLLKVPRRADVTRHCDEGLGCRFILGLGSKLVGISGNLRYDRRCERLVEETALLEQRVRKLENRDA